MVGATLTKVTGSVGDDQMRFTASDGRKWVMYHSQDCCESVRVEEIVGELDDLIGSPILSAEESSNQDEDAGGTHTWTFYRVATANGLVVIRWLGESNGYYSESVEFVRDQSERAA